MTSYFCGEKARKTSAAMIKTGTKRSKSGGGGNGGKTSGSTRRKTVTTTMTMIDTSLKYLNMNSPVGADHLSKNIYHVPRC